MQQVLQALPAQAAVSASLVWVRVMAEDDEQAAQVAAGQFQHPLLEHFYDPRQQVAREMATVLGGPGHFAWDVYLFFDSRTVWRDRPPLPADWVHQLDHSSWALPERQRKGEALVEALQSILARNGW